MNIISNDCLGAYMYKNVYNETFKNPFMWSEITIDNYLKLISNYNTINFNNIELCKNKYNKWHKHESSLSHLCIKIDNQVIVEYVHYRFNPSKTTPITNGCDVFYYKPWELIYNNYIKRINRMVESPVFCAHFDTSKLYRQKITNEHLNELCNICIQNNYKLILFTDFNFTYNDKNILILPSRRELFFEMATIDYKSTVKEFFDQ